MQLCQVNKNQNSFGINLRVWRNSVRSWCVCMRSEVSSRARVTFRRHDEYSWGQGLGIFIKGPNAIEGHTCTRIDFWPHADQSWPHRMTSQLNQFRICVDFHWLGATAFLLGLQKQPLSYDWLLHTSDLQLGEDKIHLYLIPRLHQAKVFIEFILLFWWWPRIKQLFTPNAPILISNSRTGHQHPGCIQ